MVALLDVPGVHEAVEHIVAAERAEAERAAERLRAELAGIEARLAELRSV
jgi:vacuolar-type H+-ATPase subunit E/Vma4